MTAGRLEVGAAALVGTAAVAVLGYRLGTGAPATAALTAALAVLVVAAPLALRLVTGLPLIVGTGRAAQLGVLLPGRAALTAARRVDTVLVAGTGPLGAGDLEVQDVHPVEGVAAADVLRLAGAVAGASERPLDRAVAAASGPLPDVADFDTVDDLGVRGIVAEVVGAPDDPVVLAHAVLVGSAGLLAAHEIALPAELADAAATTTAAGRVPVLVAWDGVARAVLVVGRSVPQATTAAVRALRGLGLRPVLLTADAAPAAHAVATRSGISAEDVLAGAGPDQGPAFVERLRAAGAHVAVIADPGGYEAVLRVADLAVCVGRAPADLPGPAVVLVRADLVAAVDALRLARRTGAVVRANGAWALLCLAAVLPAAAAGLVGPVLAAAATAAGAAVLVGNGLRLQRHRTTDG